MERSIRTFKNCLNSLDKNKYGIKFTRNLGGKRVEFLDVMIHIEEGGLAPEISSNPQIEMGTYPLSAVTILYGYKIYTKGQITRIRRKCTSIEDYDE